MPLRSVEAATRDDAIAAAREQFGPQVRVVGVRRVRSGGVLGFFATERYVAEVAPDAGRPPVPAPGRTSRDELGSSPLASASPATAAPSSARPRGGAPARNGAAAYAAEAVRPEIRPEAVPPQVRSEPARPATQAAARSLGWTEIERPVDPLVDDVRVSELAGLLGAPAAEPTPSPYARPAYPRTGGVQKVTFAKAPWTTSLDDEGDDVPAPELSTSSAPSPFTAALARMVAGDSHVREAVEHAVEHAAGDDVGEVGESAAAMPSPLGVERRAIRSTPVRSADTAVWPRAARQEEETVGDQVIAPPSMPEVEPVERSTWVAEPEVVSTSDSSREEAIAAVLRSALAQGHSDEALAGILRKVLDGVSPQAALTEPALPPTTPELVMSDNVVAIEPAVAPVTEPVAVAEPALPEPVDQPAPVHGAPVFQAPVFQAPVHQAPVRQAPAFQPFPAPPTSRTPVFEPFATSDSMPAVDIWGTPTSTPLWGEAMTSTPVVRTDAPIWAEVVLGEPPLPTTMELHAEADEAPVDEAPMDEIAKAPAEVLDADVESEPLEFVVESAVEAEAEAEIESAVEEVAPMLARTASDPAPFALPMSMSLDATSVMPPLSLLPPLPSSRGRGRPPVPPATSRPPVPASRPAGGTAATPEVEEQEPVAGPVTGPPTLSLATVTRLPVAPLMAGPEIPEIPELAEQDIWGSDLPDAEVEELEVVEVPAPAVATTDGQADTAPVAEPVAEPAVEAPEVSEVVAMPGDVASRLGALGLPSRLLGTTFADDVERHGLYAALTRALGLRLPAAPELPTGAGEVLFVVGPGVETLRAARRIAASLCLDPDRVQWATCSDLAGLAPEASRVTTIDGAMARRQDASHAGTVTIVAVDAPMRADAYWMRQMLAIWSPVAVWAVVEATRKPEDVEPWLDGMTRLDALIVTDTDLSADPAAVLHRVAAPVAVLDGVRATPHRWASLLCERLEGTEA